MSTVGNFLRWFELMDFGQARWRAGVSISARQASNHQGLAVPDNMLDGPEMRARPS
jgi:hypothetical protein